ncbi:SoxR reducing system RseC family protein [candidate division WOR-3 bacterium]|nr:SoxR reducing system RseC family protein [candidate division WOR-3 bacterium]
MDEKGEVTRVIDGTVEVTLEPSNACITCPVCEYCRPAGKKRVIIAANPGDIEVGDEVAIHTTTRYRLIAVFSFFGLPIVLSLIGLLVGQSYGEIRSLIIGTGGFILGLIIAKVIDSIAGRKRALYPKITRIRGKTDS